VKRDRTRWCALIASAAYVVIVAVGLFAVPAAPGVDASGSRLVSFYAAHASGVRLVTWLGALSLVPLALLVANLRARVTHGVSRDITMLGGAGVLSSTIIWLWFGAGLALHAHGMAPATARALADTSAYFAPTLTASIILLITPVGLAAWRGDSGLPRWLGWVTIAFAFEQTVETVTILGRRGFIAPGGAMNFDVGAVLFLVWVLAAGIALSRSSDVVVPAV